MSFRKMMKNLAFILICFLTLSVAFSHKVVASDEKENKRILLVFPIVDGPDPCINGISINMNEIYLVEILDTARDIIDLYFLDGTYVPSCSISVANYYNTYPVKRFKVIEEYVTFYRKDGMIESINSKSAHRTIVDIKNHKLTLVLK